MLVSGGMWKVESFCDLVIQKKIGQRDISMMFSPPKILFFNFFLNRSKLAALQLTHNSLLQEYSSALKTVEELKRKEVLVEKN